MAPRKRTAGRCRLGHVYAAVCLGRLMQRRGDRDAAATLFHQALDTGDAKVREQAQQGLERLSE